MWSNLKLRDMYRMFFLALPFFLLKPHRFCTCSKLLEDTCDVCGFPGSLYSKPQMLCENQCFAFLSHKAYSFSRVLAICIRFKRLKFSARCLQPFALPPSGIQNEHQWRAMSCRSAFLLSGFCDLDIQKLCSFLPMSAAFAVSVQSIRLWNTINGFTRSLFSTSCRIVSGGCGRHSHSEIPPF